MSKLRMNKYLWLCFGAGILVIHIGILSGPLLPYPDPTPELNLIYQNQAHRSKILINIGFMIVAISLLSMMIRKFIRKK